MGLSKREQQILVAAEVTESYAVSAEFYSYPKLVVMAGIARQTYNPSASYLFLVCDQMFSLGKMY